MRSLPRPPRGAGLPAPVRLGAWLLLALAVLLAHLLLLHALPGGPERPGAAAAPLQLRWIVADLPAAPGGTDAAMAQRGPLLATAPGAVPSAAPRSRARASGAVVAPAADDAPAAAAPGAAAGAAPAEPGAEPPWPVYATRLPDPALLHYKLQRGGREGLARLQWQRDDSGYQLRLDTEWPGQPGSGAASRGLVDADGLAPVRQAQLRRSREVRAVNFQREAGIISFSGPQRVYALGPGAQDRVSWLIQLPAIVAADESRARPGGEIALFVAGPSGDAEVWRFAVEGREHLTLPAGEVADALYLRREPTRPYDTRVEVWLDPARAHLPVRVRYTPVPGDEPLLLELTRPAGASPVLP